MKRLIGIPLILLSLSSLGAATRNFQLPERPFNSIVLETSLDIHVQQGLTPSLKITGENPSLANVTVTVKGNQLIFAYKESKKIRFFENRPPIKAELVIPYLTYVNISGSGDIDAEDTFRGEELKLVIEGSGDLTLPQLAYKAIEATIHGSGDMSLGGECGETILSVNGSGDMKTASLKSKSAKATVSGSGDMTLTATDRLRAVINGSGDLVYAGSPRNLSTEVNGSGSIRKATR